MVQLTGNNLPKRQQELNIQVNEAAANNTSFDELKSEEERSDVDRLFKIDLAAKLKNVDFIIETLKSGDSLYVSRALKKCLWLFDDEHAEIMNTDYLHHHIFPYMSIKMKNKLLTAVIVHLKSEDRAADFYKYCMQGTMNDLAYKFLIHTSEAFKLDVVKDVNCKIYNKDHKYLKCFIGNSFVLFESYLQIAQCNGWGNKNKIIADFSYLYNISDTKYLELLEKYANVKKPAYTNPVNLGLRISKDIVTKHKVRVLKKPLLYINILNVNKLLRHSVLSDVKLYAVSLLPKEASEFWDMQYYQAYKPIIHAIPEAERYSFVKKMFTDNYLNEEFEMRKEFYSQKYFNLMTKQEKETWALAHIASKKEFLGSGLDYSWYKFINFDMAFEEIKKLIKTATEKVKRLDMLKVLVESAETQRELEKLCRYFYERHVNESKITKEVFLKKVLSLHNVFEFDDDCWEAFNKILYSVEVYNMADSRCNPDFKIISMIYHILNNKVMPDAIKKYIEYEMSIYSLKQYVDKLNEENKQRVFTYISNIYLDSIKKYVPGSENDLCIGHIHYTLELMALYGKSKEDIPETVMKFINRDFSIYKNQQILENKTEKVPITDCSLVRNLKEDSKIVIDKVSEIKEQMTDNWYFRLNRLLRKLKIYFASEEVTKHLLNFLKDFHNEYENHYRATATVVYGIIQLNDANSNVDFMNKFAPESSKIDHSIIDRKVLGTREAICRYVCYSRPPVPLSSVLMYLKGDYVHYCLPMMNMYLSNLPQPLCLKFVESLLDSPVSIQKHGLRLAFKCFDKANLAKLVLNSWKNTKNVSLRSVIYKALYEKIVNEKHKEMYETLKTLTLDLHYEDKDDIFSILMFNKLPEDFIEVVWATLEKFHDNEQNIDRKTEAINQMGQQIHAIKKDFIKKIVSDHIHGMFNKTELHHRDEAQKLASLLLAKWDLVAHYIVYYTRNEEDCSESTDMAKLIVGKCLAGWNDVVGDIYANRRIYAEFLKNLKKIRFVPDPDAPGAIVADNKSFENSEVVFEAILNELQAALPLHEIYMDVWNLRIAVISRRVLKDCSMAFVNDYRPEVVEETGTKYGRELGVLVKDFVQKKMYFSSFVDKIAELINRSASDINCYLGLKRTSSLSEDHISVATARGILEAGIEETSLLALHVLPVDPECDLSFFKSVYDVIRNVSDMAVQSCLHQKYSGNYKRRRFE